jgi:hypothetical protein
MVIAAVVLGVFITMAGLLYLTRPYEPTYQDKTLSDWIVPFCSQTSTGLNIPLGPQHFEELQPVRHAISQIGTNGVPYLTAKLVGRESPLHRKLRELAKKQPITFLRLTDPYAPKIRAIRALAVLGSRGRPAIPALSAQLPEPLLSDHAVYALSAMGPDGFRTLVDQYTNMALAGQMVTAITLSSPGSYYRGENSAYSETNGITSELLIEGLSRVIESGPVGFRMGAIMRLNQLGLEASNAIPVVLQIIKKPGFGDRQEAVRTLGHIAPPEVAVPALTNLLDDHDLSVQIAARMELRRIGYPVSMTPNWVQPSFRPGRELTPFMTNGRALPPRPTRLQ